MICDWTRRRQTETNLLSFVCGWGGPGSAVGWWFGLWRDAVLGGEESLKGGREGLGELLPGEQEETAAKVGGADGAEDLEPGFVEVGASAIGEEGEPAAGGVSREGSAEELIVGEVAGVRAGKILGVEGQIEVAVAGDEGGACLAEAGFGEFGLEEEIAEEEVGFGAVGKGSGDGDIGADAELRSEADFDLEELAGGRAAEDARVAEEIHEEGVGGVGAVELGTVGAVVAAGDAGGGGVGLGEAGGPGGVGQDATVAGGKEVAVGGGVRVGRVEDAGGCAVGELVWVGGGSVEIAGGELAAQGGGGRHAGDSRRTYGESATAGRWPSTRGLRPLTGEPTGSFWAVQLASPQS